MRRFILLKITINTVGLLALMLGCNAYSQKTSVELLPLSAFIAELKSTANGQQKALQIESLIYDVQNSIYINNGIVKQFGEQPKVLFIDASSFAGGVPEFDADAIQLITIKIRNNEDLSGNIDLLPFQDFPNLKYICVVSEIDIQESALEGILKNIAPQWKVFYTIVKPS